MPDNPSLYVKEVTDIFARTNFKNLADYFAKQNQLLDFKFFEVEYSGPVSEQKLAHGLGRAPRDVIRCEAVGAGLVTLHRGLFDATYLYISTTAACKLRFFVGTYFNSVSSSTEAADAVEQWIVQLRNKRENLTGVDGTNKKFTLSEAPFGDDFVRITDNGVLKLPERDYTISEGVVSMVTAPVAGHFLDAEYLY